MDDGELTIEAIAAVDPPREHRLSPRDRRLAFTQEASGARQLFMLDIRSGLVRQVTASATDVSDPQWSPDGRRLAFCADETIWITDADGGRLVRVDGDPAGTSHPRWSPDGGRIGFISRRRGWSGVWLVDAPIPRRGRPAKVPRPVEARPLTAGGIDVETFDWAPDGSHLALAVHAPPGLGARQVVILSIAAGTLETVGDGAAWDVSPRWASDGSLLYVSDASGWSHVVRRSPDGRERTTLTAGDREHGEPGGAPGWGPVPSPDARHVLHVEVHDGCSDLVVSPMAPATPLKRPRGRPPKLAQPPAAFGPAVRIDPWDGVWRPVGWTADGAWVVGLGESEARPQDAWLLPVPGVAPEGSRPRQLTASLPAVLGTTFGGGRVAPPERVSFRARDGLALTALLWRPPAATGHRGGTRVPCVVYVHGGPAAHAFRYWIPFKQRLVRDGFAVLDIDYRGSTGHGRDFRLANQGRCGEGDVGDVVDAGRWAAAQPWCDGRLAVYGGSWGGMLVLGALAEEPGLWRAGVDLFGDSDLVESHRLGDRPGRLELERMMGSPDDPSAAPAYRRGSPVHRAERIEAPLLILHGRLDRRVVPRMTELMADALAREGKAFEVGWYDEEEHGWKRRETKRDAYRRTRDFLRRHLLGVTA